MDLVLLMISIFIDVGNMSILLFVVFVILTFTFFYLCCFYKPQ
jgi:hypothetical protein